MLFINPIKASLLILSVFLACGCQTTKTPSDNTPALPQHLAVVTEAEAAKQVIDFSSMELSLAEQMFNSPNLYLTPLLPLAPNVKAQFEQATALIEQGKLTQAVSQFELLHQHNPMLSGPLLKLGDIALKRQQQSIASDYFKQALSLNANNYVASSRLATIKREQGDFAGAKKHYLLALNSWPGLVSAHINLGILYDLYLGNKEDALAHYKLAQRLNELANKPTDKRLKMWIVDVSRQLKHAKKEG